ncbi:MAG TPA: alpha/beta hydrolase [Bacteroidia bacterium]|jgi:pimeloyl-ACP methyl ester carboxylesterase|nr:alpha/beta hydrolase [Bacteroidia bacterium]
MTTPLTLYFISGLGADKRVFQKLKLPAAYKIVYVDWITPLPEESLAAYAQRLSAVIDPDTPFVLIGVSMGGMMAMEISKFLNPRMVILISSIKGDHDLPWYFRMAGAFQLDKFIPGAALNTPSSLAFFVGTNDEEGKKLIAGIAKDADPVFVKWAMRAIIDWRNDYRPPHLYHIHGSADKVLPAQFTTPDVILEGGEHLMVYSMADQVSEFITKKLAEVSSQ